MTIIKSCRGSAFISKKVRKGYMSRDEAARVPAGLRNRSSRRSNQFKESRSSTLTVTITAVSRPNLGTCLLLFTEIKPSKLLDLILLSNFLGAEHFRCSFCFHSSQLRKSLSAIYLQFALGGLFYPELCIPAQNRMTHHG